MATQPRLKLALIGLGRLGAIRARILAFQQPRIELVAACDTKPGSDKWAAENLPPSVRYYADPEDCMRNSGAEAVLISTATATHAPLICMGLDLGLVSVLLKVEFQRALETDIWPACDVRETHLGGCHYYRGGAGQVQVQASPQVLGAFLSKM